MSIDLADHLETLGVRIDGPDEHQAAKVRELVQHYARDADDEQQLLDMLGFGDMPPGPAVRSGPVFQCGRPMRGERICGRLLDHNGPHRSEQACAELSRRRRSPES